MATTELEKAKLQIDELQSQLATLQRDVETARESSLIRLTNYKSQVESLKQENEQLKSQVMHRG